MGIRAMRAAFLLAAACLVVVYYVVPGARPIAAGLVGLLSVAVIATGIVRRRPRRWGSWALIALAAALVTAGMAAFAVSAHGAAATQAYPDLADACYLAAYVALAVALVSLGCPTASAHRTGMLLDVASLSLAGSLLLWLGLLRPALIGIGLTLPARVIAIATFVGFVAVLAAVVRILLDWHRNAALRVLGVGVLAFLTADVLFNYDLLRGTAGTGRVIDAGYFAFLVLAGLAALSPAMTQLGAEAGRTQGPTVGLPLVVELVVLSVAMLIAPTVLLVEATPGPVTAGAAIGIASAAIAILVLIRIWLNAGEHHRRVRRERAVQVASRQLVSATTEGEVLATIDHALGSMLPNESRHQVSIVAVGARKPSEPALSLPDDMPDGLAELSLPLPDAQVDSQGPRQPRVLQLRSEAKGLAAVMPSLEVVADQAGAALERIALINQLRVDERERYFRTLVLTSRHVTLISRAGRVDYATPSAEEMFGRDVRGELVGDLVEVPEGREDSEALVRRPDGSTATVELRQRDLTADPTVSGIVTTLRDITSERKLQRELAYRASHDPLTGLANGEAFHEELRGLALRRRPASEPARAHAVLFMDLDDFKAINDTYGHDVGDRLLIIVARRIETCLRSQDLAARLGGDEFAVLLRDLPDENAARSVAQRIADTLAQPAVIDGVGLSCQASIGLAYSATGAAGLLQQADAALYTAKERGKGRWSQFRQGMTTPTRGAATARQRIEHAIRTGALAVHYQPIVELTTGDAAGFEALVRLRDGGAPMATSELVRIADDTGLIGQLGAWTLHQALSDVGRLNERAGPRYVSVNVSARQLRQPDFVDMVHNQLAATGTDPRSLVLEITEDLHVGDDYDRAWDFLAQLRGDGVRIAIDDYGTGYSSMSYLRRPGIDILKIDQSFVMGATEPRARALLRYVTELCQALGLVEVAEGIDDVATRDVLIDLGCPLGQGFFYAPGMPIDQAALWRAGSG